MAYENYFYVSWAAGTPLTSGRFEQMSLNIQQVKDASTDKPNGVLQFNQSSNASANWTLNVRGSSGTSLNTLMTTGQSVTIAFLVTQGSTAYYQSAFQVDGSSVTPKWQGGTAPTAGNASSIDA